MNPDQAPDEALKRAASLFCRSDGVQTLTKKLNDLVDAGDADVAVIVADRLRKKLDVVTRLTKAADDLDTHALDDDERERLWGLNPQKLADEALRLGELRQRRMVLQAKEAQTNRLLAYVAFGTAIVAVLISVFEQLELLS